MSGSGAVLLLEKVPQRLWPGSERSVTPVVDLPASSSVGNNGKKKKRGMSGCLWNPGSQ